MHAIESAHHGFRAARVAVMVALCAVVVAGCSESDPLAKVRELNKEKEYGSLIQLLRAMLDENPDQPEVNFMLGAALMRTGDSSSAIWPLRRAMESPDFVVDAGLMLGRAELTSRTPRDVIVAVEPVLAVEPDNIEALLIRAQAYLNEGRGEDALVDLERVAEFEAQNFRMLANRVVALIGLKRIDEAEDALAAAKKVLETTDEDVSEVQRGRLCVANGFFAFEKGDSELATELYEECLEAYPTNQLVIFQAVSHFDRLGEPERATGILRAAFEESRVANFRKSLAERMSKLGDHEEAERLYREEAEERSNARAWFTLADYYVVRERYGDACDAFEKALEAEKNPAPMVRFAYVDTLIQAARYQDAQREIPSIEDEPMRNLLTGRLLLAQGKPVAALRAFEAGLRLWPNNATARFLAGQAAEQIGDFGRAIEEYREAQRGRRERGETEAAVHLARILADRGSHEGALSALHNYLSIHPDHIETLQLIIRSAYKLNVVKPVTAAMKKLTNAGHADLAMVEQIAIVTDEAGAQATIDAVETWGVDMLDPANVNALRALMATHASLGQYAESRALAAKALKQHPEVSSFHELAGHALRADGGELSEVRALFDRALELEPDNAYALSGLAEVTAAQGDLDQAIALYDRATAADSEDVAAERAVIALLQSAGRTEEAQQRLAGLVVKNPRDAVSANALARSLAEAGGDLDRALSYARRAAYFETEPEASETLGWIHYRRGEFAAAVEVLTAAVASRPDASSTRYRLGLALAAQGEHDRARDAFEAVISASGAESAQARSEIARLDQTATGSGAK